MLFGWLASNPAADVAPTLAAMSAALTLGPREKSTLWTFPGFGIGVLENAMEGDGPTSNEPARAADGAGLWMAGEAFDWPSRGACSGPLQSRERRFRQILLDELRTKGAEVIRDLDGEYQIALWDPSARTVLLLNDRFAALPIYMARNVEGVAFAGGVRGVLMAPGVTAEPDPDAIREAVTFGGFRLGTRTNVRGVTMVPPASCVTLTASAVTTRRYWSWSELPAPATPDRQALLEETRAAWRDAVRRRLGGSSRSGLTLSGGLDSRAILAEASAQHLRMSALTYGVPEADDVKIAARAAITAGADWTLFRLYEENWLERRAEHIQATDGLVNLVDLMHVEPVTRMPELFDIYLSGYIGDAVTGSTLFTIRNADDLMGSMPYYGDRLGMPYADARHCAEQILAGLDGPPRFAPFEHKLVQSTNRITGAARPYVRVRRPFVDYRFFEIAQRVPPAWRANHAWHEEWLVSTYPKLFARIPNQRTGVPPRSSWLRWQATRTTRFAWRRLLTRLRAQGVDVAVPERSFHPDDLHWAKPDARRKIEETILRTGSISADVFGREQVQATLSEFFDESYGAVQVIGALFVFEHYHRTLPSFLAAARETGALIQC
jgi:Asparagine synthase/Glutamine amidotransferase domain